MRPPSSVHTMAQKIAAQSAASITETNASLCPADALRIDGEIRME